MTFTELLGKVEDIAEQQNEILETQAFILRSMSEVMSRVEAKKEIEPRLRRIEKLMNLPSDITEHGSSSE